MIPVRQAIDDDVVLDRLSQVEGFDCDPLDVEGLRDAVHVDREIELLVVLGAAVNIARGWGTVEARRISDRIQELIEGAKPSLATTMALIRLAGTYKVAGRFDRAAPWNEASLVMADAVGNATLRSVAASDAAHCLAELGDFEAANELYATAVTIDDSPDRAVIYAYGQDPVPQSLALDSLTMLALGHLDRARAQMERAVEAARRSEHPFTRCLVLANAAERAAMLDDPEAAFTALEGLEEILSEHQFPFWFAWAIGLRGWLIGGSGRLEQAVELLRRSLDLFRGMGIPAWTSLFVVRLAELEHRRGAPNRAFDVLSRGEQETDPEGAPVAALELAVQRGRLLRLEGEETAHETLLRALETAESMPHRFHALAAATELAMLHEAEGSTAAAVEILAPRYEAFQEGLATPLLTNAREVLDRLR